MKTVIFSVALLSLLVTSCMPDDNDYYYSRPNYHSNSEINLKGTVVGIDSLQAMDSVKIQMVFPEWPYDTIIRYSNACGSFAYLYNYNGNEEFELWGSANDTLHQDYHSHFTFNGRDVTAGHFDFSIVLDTL